MDEQIARQTQEIVQLRSTLEQTEQDLAAAILIIQEKTQSEKIEFAIDDSSADNADLVPVGTRAGFGGQWPADPLRGDMFLRTDQLPHKLYKFNGNKWIEVVKTTTDRYAYEEEYIKYVATKVRNGEYNFSDLSQSEQEEVLKHLDYNTRRKL